MIGQAFIEVKPDSKGFGTQTEKDVLSSVTSIAKKAAVAFGAAFVVKQGVDFFKGALDEAEEARKAAALTEAVVKSTGGAAGVSQKQVGDLADKLSGLSGIDDEVIQQSENVLLTFTRIKNNGIDKTFDKAQEAALNMSAALGTDLQGATVQVGKALNDPIQGLTTLRRVGIQFTDQQKEQIKSMVASGNIAGAQGVILDELGKKFAGAAEAAASPVDRLKVAWQNLKETLGTAIIPAVGQVVPVLVDTINSLQPVFEKLGGVIANAFTAIAPIITDTIGPVLGTIADSFGGIITAIAPVLADLAGAFSETFSTLGPAIASTVTEIAQAVGPAIQALSPIIGIIGNSLEAVLPILSEVIGGIASLFTEFVGPLLADLGPILGQLAGSIKDSLGLVISALKPVFDALGPVLETVAHTIGSTLGDVAAVVGPVIQQIAGTIAQLLPVVVPIISQLAAVFAGLVSEIGPIFQQIAVFIGGVFATLVPIIAPILTEISTVIGQTFQTLFPVIEQLIPIITQVLSTIGSVLAGLATTLAPVIATIASTIGAVLTTLGPVIVQIAGVISQLFTTLAPVIVQLGAAIGQVVAALAPAIASIITSLAPLLPVVADIVAQLVTGLAPVIPKLVAAFAPLIPVVAGLVTTLLDGLAPVLPVVADAIGSVAKLLAGALGTAIAALAPVIAQLITALAPVVTTLIEGLAPILPVIAQLLGEVATALGGALGTALTAIAPILKQMASTLGGVLGDVLKTLAPVFKDLAKQIGPLLSAMAPLVGIFSKLLATVDAAEIKIFASVIEALLPVVSKLAEALLPLVGLIADLLVAVTPLISAFADSLGPALEFVANIISTGLTAAMGIVGPIIDGVAGTLRGIIDVLRGVIDFVSGVFSGDWSKAWHGIEEVFRGVWEGISSFFSTVFGVIIGVVRPALDAIGNIWSSFWGSISGVVSGAWGLVTGIVSGAIHGITGLFQGIADVVRGIWDAMWRFIVDTVPTAIGHVISFLTGLPGQIGDLIGKVFDKIKGLGASILSGIADAFSKVGDFAKRIVNAVIGFINDKVIDGINDLVEFNIGPIHIDPPDLPHIPKLALGSILNGPTLAVFGEAGPEMRVKLSDRKTLLELLVQSLQANNGPSSIVNAVTSGGSVFNSVVTNPTLDVVGATPEVVLPLSNPPRMIELIVQALGGGSSTISTLFGKLLSTSTSSAITSRLSTVNNLTSLFKIPKLAAGSIVGKPAPKNQAEIFRLIADALANHSQIEAPAATIGTLVDTMVNSPDWRITQQPDRSIVFIHSDGPTYWKEPNPDMPSGFEVITDPLGRLEDRGPDGRRVPGAVQIKPDPNGQVIAGNNGRWSTVDPAARPTNYFLMRPSDGGVVGNLNPQDLAQFSTEIVAWSGATERVDTSQRSPHAPTAPAVETATAIFPAIADALASHAQIEMPTAQFDPLVKRLVEGGWYVQAQRDGSAFFSPPETLVNGPPTALPDRWFLAEPPGGVNTAITPAEVSTYPQLAPWTGATAPPQAPPSTPPWIFEKYKDSFPLALFANPTQSDERKSFAAVVKQLAKMVTSSVKAFPGFNPTGQQPAGTYLEPSATPEGFEFIFYPDDRVHPVPGVRLDYSGFNSADEKGNWAPWYFKGPVVGRSPEEDSTITPTPDAARLLQFLGIAEGSIGSGEIQVKWADIDQTDFGFSLPTKEQQQQVQQAMASAAFTMHVNSDLSGAALSPFGGLVVDFSTPAVAVKAAQTDTSNVVKKQTNELRSVWTKVSTLIGGFSNVKPEAITQDNLALMNFLPRLLRMAVLASGYLPSSWSSAQKAAISLPDFVRNHKIPQLAGGGILMPRPGGHLVNVAEGASAEAVIPLPPDVLQSITSTSSTSESAVDQSKRIDVGGVTMVVPDVHQAASRFVSDLDDAVWQHS